MKGTMRKIERLLILAVGWLVSSSMVFADEGMWLFSTPPRSQLRAAHGFIMTEEWLGHLMKTSIRFPGASGSFVSGDGLVLTNHHVGLTTLQKLSSREKNLVTDGYCARNRDEELKCPGLEVSVLQSIEDVTARVAAAVPGGMRESDSAGARRRIFSEIETESRAATGLRSEIVTLYGGGQYHLYRYRNYKDVRLVFAPESAIAAFGGDPDNFEYPRFNLDVCLFRVYEEGSPLHPEHFLRLATRDVEEGELVFVSGHPGGTSRLRTAAELDFQRDIQLPGLLDGLRRQEVALLAWSARSEEKERLAARALMNIQNSRKAYEGQLAALQDLGFMQSTRKAESDLRQQLEAAGNGNALGAFERIRMAERQLAVSFTRYRLLEGAAAFAGVSYSLARDLLRDGDERLKPDGARLRPYAGSRRESLERALLAPNPISADLEIVRLSTSLTLLVDKLGFGDPVVQTVLAGQSPRNRAAALIRETRVGDVAFRRKLYEGGAETVAAAHDPLIELARSVDHEARALRQAHEELSEIIEQAHALVNQARFMVTKSGGAPDATGTLRLSYGLVKGYEEDGARVNYSTTLGGLFERSAAQHGRPPFALPARWLERKELLGASTVFNFVTTCDIIGGNSGSPAVNRAGELVGVVFDGNRQSLSADIAYDDLQARAINVAGGAIIEVLRQVYDLPLLADELATGRTTSQR